MSKTKISAPNTPDALGHFGSIDIKEYINKEEADLLNSKLGVCLNEAHRKTLNIAISCHSTFTSMKKSSRSETYNALKNLRQTFQLLIELFSHKVEETSFLGEESVKRSVLERIMLARIELGNHFSGHHIPFFQEDKRDAFLQEVAFYIHVIDKAILDLDLEVGKNKGGRPKDNNSSILFQEIERVFKELDVGKADYSKTKRYERFGYEILQFVPNSIRPKLEKLGSISKKTKRSKS